MEESPSDAWRILSHRVFAEREGWHKEHPTAPFRESEEERDARRSGRLARMLEDLAQQRLKRAWSEQESQCLQ